jgi:Divergent InlB B-repeat domain
LINQEKVTPEVTALRPPPNGPPRSQSPAPRTLDLEARADGTASGGGTFAEGTSQTVTATPNTGHTFVHWSENGRVVSTSESYTFTLPSANITLVADFH